MARIEMGPEAAEDPRVREVFEWVESRWPEVPNLYKALGAAPGMLKAWVDFAWALRLEAKTDRGLRELIILRGAQVSNSVYEWAQHVPMALEAGVSRAKVDALSEWRGSDLFDAGERAALALAEEATGGPGARAETVAALSAEFGDEAAVELVLTATFYACVGRVIESLGVEVEPRNAAAAEGFRPG